MTNLHHHEQPLTLIYRGIEATHNKERVGAWWSTNPYYALRYSSGGRGDMFVALVDNSELEEATDASLEAEYENYLFPDKDPPNARPVTPEEIEQLKAATTVSSGNDILGGALMKWPENAIEIGQRIFNPQAIGSTALTETVDQSSTDER